MRSVEVCVVHSLVTARPKHERRLPQLNTVYAQAGEKNTILLSRGSTSFDTLGTDCKYRERFEGLARYSSFQLLLISWKLTRYFPNVPLTSRLRWATWDQPLSEVNRTLFSAGDRELSSLKGQTPWSLAT